MYNVGYTHCSLSANTHTKAYHKRYHIQMDITSTHSQPDKENQAPCLISSLNGHGVPSLIASSTIKSLLSAATTSVSNQKTATTSAFTSCEEASRCTSLQRWLFIRVNSPSVQKPGEYWSQSTSWESGLQTAADASEIITCKQDERDIH
jgi:hypothetical protein